MSRNREKGQSRPAGRILRQSAPQTATLAPARSSVSSEKYNIRCGKQKAETEAPCKDRSDGARTQRCGEELVGIKVVERRLKPVAEGVRPEEQAQEHGRGLSEQGHTRERRGHDDGGHNQHLRRVDRALQKRHRKGADHEERVDERNAPGLVGRSRHVRENDRAVEQDDRDGNRLAKPECAAEEPLSRLRAEHGEKPRSRPAAVFYVACPCAPLFATRLQ